MSADDGRIKCGLCLSRQAAVELWAALRLSLCLNDSSSFRFFAWPYFGLVRSSLIVVTAGSKGKEQFLRPQPAGARIQVSVARLFLVAPSQAHSSWLTYASARC